LINILPKSYVMYVKKLDADNNVYIYL
jgi:hypothetical protein